MKTDSEDLFELYCVQNDIPYEPVPTKSDERKKTPDYDVFPNSKKTIVEIKQIDPNPEEKNKFKLFLTQHSVSGQMTPGSRVRSKITKAAPQICVRSNGIYPSILVLYNNVINCDHTTPYNILVGMYGFETHVLGVSKKIDHSPFLIDKKFGPKQKMTKNDNTSISAIAVLKKNNEKPDLLIYHNIFAKIPLEPSVVRLRICV
jgi:hypothetical protein